MRGGATEVIERFEIGERDGWKCGICQGRINHSLRHPDPKSASLDHIVPISVGGTHTRENVQIAHLVCNVRKGNRGAGEQLALIG
ncbi:HNH endonuclease [Rhodococcus sp. D2-41]|nr:HNH endonuclease [Rhodococcus sp. D2-41]